MQFRRLFGDPERLSSIGASWGDPQTRVKPSWTMAEVQSNAMHGQRCDLEYGALAR